MKIMRSVVMAVSLCLAGCLAYQVRPDVARYVDVFGVELYSSADHREIRGIKGDEEPCMKGYERRFDPLEITIGYGFDGRIRKITTRNPRTSVFTVSPGMSAEEGRRLAHQAGLSEISSHRFEGKGILLTFLLDEKGTIFGVTVEAGD